METNNIIGQNVYNRSNIHFQAKNAASKPKFLKQQTTDTFELSAKNQALAQKEKGFFDKICDGFKSLTSAENKQQITPSAPATVSFTGSGEVKTVKVGEKNILDFTQPAQEVVLEAGMNDPRIDDYMSNGGDVYLEEAVECLKERDMEYSDGDLYAVAKLLEYCKAKGPSQEEYEEQKELILQNVDDIKDDCYNEYNTDALETALKIVIDNPDHDSIDAYHLTEDFCCSKGEFDSDKADFIVKLYKKNNQELTNWFEKYIYENEPSLEDVSTLAAIIDKFGINAADKFKTEDIKEVGKGIMVAEEYGIPVGDDGKKLASLSHTYNVLLRGGVKKIDGKILNLGFKTGTFDDIQTSSKLVKKYKTLADIRNKDNGKGEYFNEEVIKNLDNVYGKTAWFTEVQGSDFAIKTKESNKELAKFGLNCEIKDGHTYFKPGVISNAKAIETLNKTLGLAPNSKNTLRKLETVLGAAPGAPITPETYKKAAQMLGIDTSGKTSLQILEEITPNVQGLSVDMRTYRNLKDDKKRIVIEDIGVTSSSSDKIYTRTNLDTTGIDPKFFKRILSTVNYNGEVVNNNLKMKEFASFLASGHGAYNPDEMYIRHASPKIARKYEYEICSGGTIGRVFYNTDMNGNINEVAYAPFGAHNGHIHSYCQEVLGEGIMDKNGNKKAYSYDRNRPPIAFAMEKVNGKWEWVK